MIRVSALQATIKTAAADLLALCVFEDKDTFRGQITAIQNLIGKRVLPVDGIPFAGKERQTLLLFPEALRSHRLLLVGVGKRAELSAERIRRAAAATAKMAQSCGVRTAAFLEPDLAAATRLAMPADHDVWETFGMAASEGALLGLYTFDRYRTREKDAPPPLVSFLLVTESAARRRSMLRGVALAKIVCTATIVARDLENAPGNEIYPQSLADAARKAGRKNGFRVTVLDEKRIRALRMGGLLGVARGSHRPPRFIIMDYRGRGGRKPPVVLVGKGVTFDAGGISIKPSAGMAEMKMDMAGAAAVIGALQAVAALKLPVRVIGLVPATENLPGGSALKPGDIIRHHNGVTSEVDNTDAEGRLILADALSYASRYSPGLVIDLATLTGAVVVALGHFATGMMGNDPDAMRGLKEAGERTYERVWELPMFDEYQQLIRSDVADVKNTGGRWGGAITAAMFLKKFIGAHPWVHLDIAGTAIIEEPSDYTPRGGSGVGVRLLTDFLRHGTPS